MLIPCNHCFKFYSYSSHWQLPCIQCTVVCLFTFRGCHCRHWIHLDSVSGTSESLGFQLHVWVGVKGLRGLSIGSCKLGFLLISLGGGGCLLLHFTFGFCFLFFFRWSVFWKLQPKMCKGYAHIWVIIAWQLTDCSKSLILVWALFWVRVCTVQESL